MTVAQAAALADQCEKLFRRAAMAWERGSNSGTNEGMSKGIYQQGQLHQQAEALLKPLGITCSYPGLYPAYNVKGYHEHSALNAISLALDSSVKPLDNTRKAVAA